MGEDSLNQEELQALEEDAVSDDKMEENGGVPAETVVPEVPTEQEPTESVEQGDSAQSYQKNIQLLMDVYVEVTVELGRTTKTIKEILQLGEGSIIELEDRPSGEPVDILVNGRLIAKGEVVTIDENFGVRISEIIDPKERLMRLL